MEAMKEKQTAPARPALRRSRNGRANSRGRADEISPIAASQDVLIVADEAEFARSVVARWQMERVVPAFTLMTSDLCRNANVAMHGLAIIGPRIRGRDDVLNGLEETGTPALVLAADGDASEIRHTHPRAFVLRQTDGWLDVLIQMAGETLRRAEVQRYLHQAEQLVAVCQRHATLGRYMLEMRHGLNNCLTSVLGNAELLLLEPGMLSAEARDQVHTIHSMAMRMHEVMQRFSSLESEMTFEERGSHSETRAVSQPPIAGG